MGGITERLNSLSVTTKTVDLKSELASSNEVSSEQTQQEHWFSPTVRCDSPIAQYCTGDCREKKGDARDEAELANVVRIREVYGRQR